jgi:hypothetical protein
MTHSAAVLFAHFGTWFRLIPAKDKQSSGDAPAHPRPCTWMPGATAFRRAAKFSTGPGNTGPRDRFDVPTAGAPSRVEKFRGGVRLPHKWRPTSAAFADYRQQR